MERIKVTEVEALDGYKLRLVFSDGFEKIHDVSPMLDKGPIFRALRGELFKQVQIDEVAGTVCWPNGADLDPYVLRGIIPKFHGGKRAGAGRKPGAEPTESVSIRMTRSEIAALMSVTGQPTAGKALALWVKRVQSEKPADVGRPKSKAKPKTKPRARAD
jgi:hypothetical protein